jgi:hypothetical protein
LPCGAADKAGLAVEAGQVYLVFDPRLQGVGENCQMKVHPFARHPANPVLQPEYEWEFAGGRPRVQLFGTVLWDAEAGLFKMWYTAPRAGTCYATSADGLRWTKPMLGQCRFEGSAENNISSLGDWLAVVYRDAETADPAQRWVKWSYQHEPAHDGVEGDHCIYRFISADGVGWQRQDPQPVLQRHAVESMAGYLGDVVYTYWDARRRTNISYFKVTVANPNPAPDDQPKAHTHLRQFARFESADGIEWGEPSWMLTRDDEDAELDPYLQFYGVSVHPVGDFYVGFPWLYYCNEGTFDIGLAYSTDSVHWVRPWRDQYVLPRDAEGAWDSGGQMMTSAHLIEKDGLWWLYYSGCPYPHKDDTKRYFAIGLAQTPVGRLVSVRCWKCQGSWTTGPLVLAGTELRLNAAILDEARITLLVRQR